MTSQSSSSTKALKPSKPSPPRPTALSPSPSSKPLPSTSSSLTSHFAMIELKQKIITSLSKLSDRDTHHIAVEDLEKTIHSLTPSTFPILLNSLFDSSNDPKPAIKKESLRLLALLSTSHPNSTQSHLTKIVAHIVRKLKDSDSGVRDACRDAIGTLSEQYLKGDGDNGVIGLFAKPLFDAMGEQNKVVQAGAAACMAKMVECAGQPTPISGFQKLCPRVCKFLNSQNFLARAALLAVVASLSQVGAIAPQSLPIFLQSIHECLQSSDWGTRKAAADTLSTVASHSSHLVAEESSSIITALEACRFDKVKPVRDSMNEALQLWKKIAEKGGAAFSDGPSAGSRDGKGSQLAESVKSDPKSTSPGDRQLESVKDTSNASSTIPDSLSKAKDSITSDKTVGTLKKKAPALSNKELNPEFFQKLALRVSGDSPVEVVVPRRCLDSSKSQAGDEQQQNNSDYGTRSSDNVNGELDDAHGPTNVKYHKVERGSDDFVRDKWEEQRVLRGKDSKTKAFDADDRAETNQRDYSGARTGFSRNDVEGSFINNKGNWLGIQRQLLQMERQQAHLMNMLQDFMSGSHDSMVTLENRVRGLERVVEDMARDLAVSSSWRGSSFGMGLEGTSNRTMGRYNGLPDYTSAKLGRGGDGRVPFGERFPSSDGIISGSRGRDPLWRSDASEVWDSYAYGTSRNGHMASRRTLGGVPSDVRSPRSEHDDDQVGNRRAGDKGPGSIRFGEGPSARSVWQASKDEATLEAIRVAGEDNGASRVAKRVAMPELTAEAEGDDNAGQERSQIWVSWSNAMDALHVGDIDTAYAEVLSTEDDLLLVKLMDRTGPIIDQLSNETAIEVLHAIGQFLLEQNLIDIGLSWTQQLVEFVMENGPDVLGIPIESKRELLLNLHEASSAIDPPENWEGATPEQLMLQLATAWKIDLQHFEK